MFLFNFLQEHQVALFEFLRTNYVVNSTNAFRLFLFMAQHGNSDENV